MKQLDPIIALNFVMCVATAILGLATYNKKRLAMPLLVGIAFALFGFSHLATLLNFAQAWASFLIVDRTIDYLLVLYSVFRVAVAAYTRKK